MLLRGVTNATPHILSQKWEMLLYIVKNFFAPQKKVYIQEHPPTPLLPGGAVVVVVVVLAVLVVLVVLVVVVVAWLTPFLI
jgi:hypothetical protein